MSVAAVVAVALTYEWLSLRAGGWGRWRGAAFMSGCAVLILGLSLHSHDVTVHMTQHLLVAMVAPIGLVLGAPVTLLLRTLGAPAGRRVTRLLRTRLVRLLTRPVVALLLSAGSLALLYLTPLYAYAMSDPAVHAALLAHFLASGCLFVWVIAGPDPAPHRPSVRARLVVLGVAIAAHATLSQLLYAGALVQVPATDADRQTAATVMYYGGDLAELILAFAVVQTRGPARRRPSLARPGQGVAPVCQ